MINEKNPVKLGERMVLKKFNSDDQIEENLVETVVVIDGKIEQIIPGPAAEE